MSSDSELESDAAFVDICKRVHDFTTPTESSDSEPPECSAGAEKKKNGAGAAKHGLH